MSDSTTRKYSAEEMAAWQRYYDDGHSLPETSDCFGVPTSTLYRHLETRSHEEAVKPDHAERKRKARLAFLLTERLGLSQQEAAELLGWAQSTVSRHRTRYLESV
jgi:DNA-directed RNA polymerase specialized sigma24 family protein